MEKIKLAFVADIHLGELIEYRPGSEAVGLLESFVSIVNAKAIDAVIELGDRVNNACHDQDRNNLQTVANILNKLDCPLFSVLGNHDIQYISKAENKKILRLPSNYYSKQILDFTCIFLDTADPIWGHCGGTISATQLKWLDLELAKDNRPKLIFGHHPLIKQNQTGNPFFVDIPGEEVLRNHEETKNIINKGNNIIACFNGHVHWFYVSKEAKIPYFSIPSLLEAYPEKKNAPGRYVLAEISIDGSIDMSFHTINPSRTTGRIII